MSGKSLQIQIRINLPIIMGVISLLHLLSIFLTVPVSKYVEAKDSRSKPIPLNIQNLENIRRVGAKNGVKDSKQIFLNKTNSDSKVVTKAGTQVKPSTPFPNKPISFSDLAPALPKPKPIVAAKPKSTRPGTRPEVGPQNPRKAIDAISLKGAEMRKFIAGSDAVALSGDSRTDGFSNSDVLVNLEVPEGVNPDELNEYEMMFYGFQRRTAMNYVNSFYNKLEEFQKRNPHKQFPMTDTKQIMTGRLTYDQQGNIKQIKMIRWSNVDALQDFFTDVLKSMDTLHNPPTALWKKDGEFSVFFSLVING